MAKRGRKVKVLPDPKGPVKLLFPDPNNPENVALLRAELESLREQFEAGHPEALLQAAISIVVFYLPRTWVASLLMSRFNAWDAGVVASLDEAFRISSHKRKLVAHRMEIISAVTDLRRENKSRKDAFKQVAKRFKAGASSIGKVYDDHPWLRKFFESLPTGTVKFRDRTPPKA